MLGAVTVLVIVAVPIQVAVVVMVDFGTSIIKVFTRSPVANAVVSYSLVQYDVVVITGLIVVGAAGAALWQRHLSIITLGGEPEYFRFLLRIVNNAGS